MNMFTLGAQLDFERLVADLSVQFINLPADRVEDAIRDGLRRVGEALDLDRCQFFRVEPDGTALAPIGWARTEVPAAPTRVDVPAQFPWVFQKVLAGELVRFASVHEIPSPLDRAGYEGLGVRSALTVPLTIAGRIAGGVGFNLLREERTWPDDVVDRLQVFAAVFGNLLTRCKTDQLLRESLARAEEVRDRLHAENLYLRSEVEDRFGTGAIVGRSAALRSALELAEQVAATDSTVLLLGETGVGKELFASRIHELSSRRGRKMVRINCSAIPTTLIESELFGREKGAFTGADVRQIGRFELADHSTIFLDEIGDLPIDVQVKLLRVIEERRIERLGNPRPIAVDTRIIAATNRNLEERIANGSFREDLFYRLNVFPIDIPALRQRVDDIPLLIRRFVDEFSKAFGKRVDEIPRENLAALQRYRWPGNIRELRNVVERAMILATGPVLTIAPPAGHAAVSAESARLADVERAHIHQVLESTGWRIRGAGGAADRLGLRPTTLETRMAKLGLKRPQAS
jgi:formate hydrogenlyase transcriptional activator